MKKEMLIIADYTGQKTISLDELREIYGVSDELIRELIEHAILQPSQEDIFDYVQLKRLQTAMRLQRDLEVNLAGVALVLELMDELEELRARAAFLEKHILK